MEYGVRRYCLVRLGDLNVNHRACRAGGDSVSGDDLDFSDGAATGSSARRRYPSAQGSLPVRQVEGRIIFDLMDPLRLDVGRGTFFGVEEKVFQQVVTVARGGTSLAPQIGRIEQIQPFYSGIGVLRVGSIIGPIEFFLPVQQVVF
jgi:hypothetical protein